MSVRNQYARNHYKVAPTPLTSNQLIDARNAIIRRNLYRAPEHTEYTSDVRNSSSDKTKRSDVTSGNSDREVVSHIDDRKVDRVKSETDVKSFSKHETHKGTNKTVHNKTKDLVHNDGKEDKIKQKESRTNNEPLKDVSDATSQFRPKSARPDSRWERRVPDDIDYLSDDDFEDIDTSSRPISARPESRLARSGKSENMYDSQERPKTSHRRQKSAQDDVGHDSRIPRRGEGYDRPKSRVGNIKEISFDKSVDNTAKIHGNITRRRIKSQYDDADSVFHDPSYHIGISTFYPDLLDKLHGIEDINEQIDDIDMTVDPVIFFMQDNNTTRDKNTKRKTSLSKDAINVITNEKSPRQNKATIGFHGNNQNKRNSAPEVIDRFHRNKIINLQSSIYNDNQLQPNQGRHERIKSDSLINNSITGEKIYIPRTNTSTSGSSPTAGVLRSRNSDTNKQSGNCDLSVQKYNITATRKPRKLKPIPYPGFEE